MTYKIPLVRDTISEDDIQKLVNWLLTKPKLTKGDLTKSLEEKWNEYNKVKYSIYVNSGSSANLLAAYSLLLSGRLKNKIVIVPAVSWVTTVAPFIQFGYTPVMCDCNLQNFGLDIEHLKELIKIHDPSVLVTVNVLGFSNDYLEINNICKENNIILIEDSCESIGTVYNNNQTGTFGDISTFSFYFGHHISTIEGGMVCTSDEELKNIITSIRSHGWDRDLDKPVQQKLRQENNVEEFKSLYTFYYPGFNCRSTDLQAFIGLKQLEKINYIVEKRRQNFDFYNKYLDSKFKVHLGNHQFVSNFAFPIISTNINKLVYNLNLNGVETRPLICGSIGSQPFWINLYGKIPLKNADTVDKFGIYIPNNPSISEEEIQLMSDIVNKFG